MRICLRWPSSVATTPLFVLNKFTSKSIAGFDKGLSRPWAHKALIA